MSYVERLNEVACVHGQPFGDCADWYCCRARAAVLSAASEFMPPPGPEHLPRHLAESCEPYCRWCHLPIRGVVGGTYGWEHVGTRRARCRGTGRWTAEPVTPADQFAALKRRAS